MAILPIVQEHQDIAAPLKKKKKKETTKNAEHIVPVIYSTRRLIYSIHYFI